jgi:VWFA-related protein
MRRAILALLLSTAPLPLWSQNPATDTQSFTLRTESNVVLLPTQVETKQGDILYGLKSRQFVVEDSGVPQTVHLDEDTDSLGLSLVIAVQCSRSAVMEYAKIQGLATMIDGLAGDAPREVALVSYGAEPELLGDFSSDPDRLRLALNDLQPCDDTAAATLDAVAYSTSLLEVRKNHYRHAILLISESRDHGSKAKPATVIAGLGSSNTVVDAVTFAPGRNEIVNDLKYGGGSGPLGLLVMAINAVKKNAAKELAALSGGEYLNFTSQKSFDNNLHQLSNHIHNYYLLSFQPPATPGAVAGLHSLRVKIPDYPDARIRTRESYWSGSPDHVADPPSAP